MKWIANSDTIIFDCEFNEKLDIELISGYTKIIFSNYKLNEKLFEYYLNEKLFEYYLNDNNSEYYVGTFNQDISVLPHG